MKFLYYLLLLISPGFLMWALIAITYEIDRFRVFKHDAWYSIVLIIIIIVLFTWIGFKYFIKNYSSNKLKDLGTVAFFPLFVSSIVYFSTGETVYWNYHASLYVDNCSVFPVEVSVNQQSTTLEYRSYRKMTVPVGALTVTHDGQTSQLAIEPGNWIYNVGESCSYHVEEVEYGTPYVPTID